MSMKKEEREEDSGLHDIRNLAQSTKQRLSSKRVTTSPISDEDALASASGSWKNIALPQPAKMVSLPEIADLPSKSDVLAAEKAARDAAVAAKEAEKVAKDAEKAAKRAARDSKKDIAAVAPAATVAAVEPAAAAPAKVERKAFALRSQLKSSKGPLFAFVGLGVAAAAGGVIYMQMTKKSEEPAPQVAAAPPPAKVEVTTTPIEPAVAPAPPPIDTAATGSAAAEEPVAQIAAPEPEPKAEDKKAKVTKKKEHTVEIVDEGKKVPEKAAPAEKKLAPAAKGAGGEESGEPSFDALLKEAGVDDSKKVQKPTLDKKMLSGDDFKKGMSGVAAKAQGCYAGTQGTAMLKLTISPEGKVSKVTVGGAFAGKPEAECVAAAVKAATFPPWDGGPQSFNYSYMLAE